MSAKNSAERDAMDEHTRGADAQKAPEEEESDSSDGVTEEEKERTQWHPLVAAALRVTDYELNLAGQLIPERSVWKLPKHADAVTMWTTSPSAQSNPFTPGGELYTVFETKGKGDTCDLAAVHQALANAVLLVSSLHEEDRTKTIYSSEVCCLVLSYSYPRALFKEWIPTKHKNVPGFYALAPDATRVNPSVWIVVLPEVDVEQLPFLLSEVCCLVLSYSYPRALFKERVPTKHKNVPGFYALAPDATRVNPSVWIVVLPEVDVEQLPFLRMVSNKDMKLEDVVHIAEQISQIEDVARKDDANLVLATYLSKHPNALEELGGRPEMTEAEERALEILDPRVKAKYERDAQEKVQQAQEKVQQAQEKVQQAQQQAQEQVQQYRKETQAELQAKDNRIAELEALLAASSR